MYMHINLRVCATDNTAEMENEMRIVIPNRFVAWIVCATFVRVYPHTLPIFPYISCIYVLLS